MANLKIMLLFLCISITSILFAQKNKNLTGIVIDENETPLPSAMVILPANRLSVYANSEGVFSFPSVKNKEPEAVFAFLKGYKAKAWYYDEEENFVKIVLERGVVLAGIITSVNGSPLKNTSIKIVGFKTTQQLTTDRNGYFKVVLPSDAQLNSSIEFLIKDKRLNQSQFELNGQTNFVKVRFNEEQEEKKVVKTTIKNINFLNQSGSPLTNTDLTIDTKKYTTNEKGMIKLPQSIDKNTQFQLNEYDILRSEYFSDEELLNLYVADKQVAKVPVIQDDIDALPEAHNIDEELQNLIASLEKEKKIMLKNGVLVKEEVQRIKEKLAMGEQLTPELREKYRQELLMIQTTLNEIAELQKKESDGRNNSLINELQDLLLAKDALNKIASDRLLKIEQENKAAQKDYYKKLSYMSVAIILLLGLAILFYFLNIRIKKQKSELTVVNQQLEESKSDLIIKIDTINSQKDKIDHLYNEQLDSIKAAQINQLAILPPQNFLSTYLSDHFVLYKPKDIVSGDFYWWDVKGDNLYLAVVDCTGHGVAGALTSMLGYHSLNQALQSIENPSPAQILNALNEEIIHALRQDTEDALSRDGMDASVCKINLKTGKMQFAGAGNPLYIARANEIIKIDADKHSIGYSKFKKGNLAYTDQEVELMSGDTFYLFSDGYAGQLGGEGGFEKLKYNKFRDALLQSSSKSLDQQREALDDLLTNWRGKEDQTDDVTVIGFKIKNS